MGNITEEFLGELRQRIDIVEIASRYTELHKSSGSMVGLCPIHSERTPSFHVDPQKQFFHCFGCGAGGDAITLVMKMENCGYVQAVEDLAKTVGMQVPQNTNYDTGLSELKKKILEMNRFAARYYYDTLFSPEGQKGLSYLLHRGLTKNTITRFGLGYALPEWDGLYKKLKEAGYGDDEIRASGLVAVSDRDPKNLRIFDRFRDRVMFPIIDANGNVIGFGGRTMNPDDPAKYLNTAEVVTFHKGNNLYAINYAKMTKSDAFLLCEGYMDVITLHQAGFDNAVAGLGTALTEQQIRLLTKYKKKVYVCYDNDEAGKKAANRALDLMNRFDIDVKVISMTGGKDADEIIKNEGKDYFRRLVEGSQNSLDFRFNSILGKYTLTDDDQRLACADSVFQLLATLSPAATEIYSAKMAKTLGLSIETVQKEVRIRQKKLEKMQEAKQDREDTNKLRSAGDKINPQRSRYLRAAKAEEDLLAILLSLPDKRETIESMVGAEDFVTDFNRRVFLYLTEQMKEHPTEPDPIHLLSQFFTADEMGKISQFLYSIEALNVDDNGIRQAVELLKNEKEKMVARSGGSERIDDRINLLRKKKQEK